MFFWLCVRDYLLKGIYFIFFCYVVNSYVWSILYLWFEIVFCCKVVIFLSDCLVEFLMYVKYLIDLEIFKVGLVWGFMWRLMKLGLVGIDNVFLCDNLL